MRLPDLVALFGLGGLFLSGVELLRMDHTEGIQRRAPLAAFLGALLAGLGMACKRWALALALARALLAPVGLFGLLQHLEESLEAGAPVGATGLAVAAQAGQTGQPRRPPAVQEGGVPGPGNRGDRQPGAPRGGRGRTVRFPSRPPPRGRT